MNSLIESLNLWGARFLEFAVPMLYQSSLLIALILLLDLALRRKIRAAVRYTLWFVVLLKLLLPPTLALPTGAAWWLRANKAEAPAPRRILTITYPEPIDYAPEPAITIPAPPPPPPQLSAAAWMLLASTAGSIFLLAWLLARWRQIARQIRHASPAPPQIVALFADCASELERGSASRRKVICAKRMDSFHTAEMGTLLRVTDPRSVEGRGIYAASTAAEQHARKSSETSSIPELKRPEGRAPVQGRGIHAASTAAEQHARKSSEASTIPELKRPEVRAPVQGRGIYAASTGAEQHARKSSEASSIPELKRPEVRAPAEPVGEEALRAQGETSFAVLSRRSAAKADRSSRDQVEIRIVAAPISPAVCGLFRPIILLPQFLVQKLSPAQLRAVLLHELIHLRRRDVWMNCFQTFLQIAYWWHPLLWLANARIRRLREESVDDAVMLALNEDSEVYAPTLLEVAKLAFHRPLASLGLVGILESKNALRQRIERLLNFTTPRRAGLSLMSVVCIAAFTAVAVPMGEAPPRSSSPGTDLDSSNLIPYHTKVDPEVFIRNIRARANETMHTTNDAWGDILLSILDGYGINCSRGFQLNTQTGELTTQNTSEALQVLDEVINELNLPGGERILNPPYGLKQVLIEAHFYQMQPKQFTQLGLEPSRKNRDRDSSPSWDLSSNELSQVTRRIKQLGLQSFSSPRIQTSHGTQADMYIGDKTNDIELQCVPYVRDGAVDLTVLARTTGTYAPSGGWPDFAGRTNCAIFSRVGFEDGGGAILQAQPTETAPEKNLVVLLRARIIEHTAAAPLSSGLAAAQSAKPAAPNDSLSPGTPAHFTPGRQRMLEKLNTIVFDEISFPNESLNAVTLSLMHEAQKHDPDHKGVSFIISDGSITNSPLSEVKINLQPHLKNVRLIDLLEAIVRTANRPIQYSLLSSGVEFSFQSERDKPELYTRTFKFDVNDLLDRLGNPDNPQRAFVEALARAHIELSAPKSLFLNDRQGTLTVHATLDDLDAIEELLSTTSGSLEANSLPNKSPSHSKQESVASDVSHDRNLEIRTFQLDPNTFYLNLQNTAGGAPSGGHTVATSGDSKKFTQASGPQLDFQTAMVNFFHALGVDISPPKTVLFNNRSSTLTVRATPYDLDLVEAAIHALNTAPPEVSVKARFVEVAATRDSSGHIHPVRSAFTDFMKNVLTNNSDSADFMSGILSEVQMKSVMKLVDNTNIANFLNEGQLTTLSGRQAQFEDVDVMSVLPGLNVTVTNNQTTYNYQPTNMQVGYVLDLFPEVTSDQHAVSLRLTPEVTQFLGYANPKEISRYDKNLQHAQLPLPKYRRWSVTTTAIIPDGQTLVLANIGNDILIGTAPSYKAKPVKNSDKQVLVFITPTIIDRAGNRRYTERKDSYDDPRDYLHTRRSNDYYDGPTF